MELQIYGPIEDLTEQMCQIEETQEDIDIIINSPGGSAFEAFQLLNVVDKCQHNVTAKIEVMAASAAAVIALGCPKVTISSKDIVMLHNCWTVTMGNAKDHEQQVEAMKAVDNALQNIVTQYCDEETAQYIRNRMNDGELWLTGSQVAEMFSNVELVERGHQANVLAACGELDSLVSKYQNAVQEIIELKAKLAEQEKVCEQEEIVDEVKPEIVEVPYMITDELKELLAIEL